MKTIKSFTYAAAVSVLAIVSACGGGGGGGAAPPQTSDNSIVATASSSRDIHVIAGSSNAYSVTFTTSDGKTATNLSVSSGLSSLPAGWTGPTTFTCSSVSTGSGCVLNLTYAPTAFGSGTLTVNYSYTNNAGTSKSGTVSVKYAATTQDSVVATPSTTSAIHVIAGSSTAYSVTFTTSDGDTATNLSVTSGLSSLPAGWQGPKTFTCSSVSTGSGCVLNLAYAPTANGSGTLTVGYSYTNNAGTSKSGTVAVTYAATAHNNVVAAATPSGQIAAITGSSNAVGVTFTTDNGQSATALSADLSGLPTGWRAPAATFTCATVASGSGCMVNLTYAPVVIGNGTVTINYSYVDNSGTAKTGSISIPFAATSHNNVVATQTPPGQITALLGASQAVKVDFTTDDMNPATGLTITPANLTSLPSGWTGPATFTCASVTTGNGCELGLTFAPTQPGVSSTVILNYSYLDNSGTAKNGSVNINYATGSDNTVVGAASPSGTVNAIVGSGSQAVTVTFNSSDANPGSNVAITSGLTGGTPLPAGWSGPATFTCPTAAHTGSACQLTLGYNPTVAGSGTVTLGYSYKANSGAAKTGSVMIPYAATTHNNLVATASPSGTIGAVVGSGSQPVTLTFTTDDSNPATAITITSGLSGGTPLPAGWTGPSTFTCATASTGTSCQLTLTYAPTVNGSGTVSLGYGYNDDSGTAKTGTASIAYASIPQSLYVTDLTSQILRCAMSPTDGTLSSCSTAAGGFSAPIGIAFSGNWAYVSPGAVATNVDVCAVNADGSFGTCTAAHTFGSPNALAVSGGRLYVSDANGPGYVHSCNINNVDGSLGACSDNAVGTINTMDGVSVTATTAYIVDVNGNNLTTCTVSAVDGTLSACSQQSLNDTAPGGGNTPTASPKSVTAYGGNLYIGTTAAVLLLPINPDGTVTIPTPPATCESAPSSNACTLDDLVTQTPVGATAFNNGYAYITGNAGVGVCTVEPSGVPIGLLDTCSTNTSPSATGYYGGLAVH